MNDLILACGCHELSVRNGGHVGCAFHGLGADAYPWMWRFLNVCVVMDGNNLGEFARLASEAAADNAPLDTYWFATTLGGLRVYGAWLTVDIITDNHLRCLMGLPGLSQCYPRVSRLAWLTERFRRWWPR